MYVAVAVDSTLHDDADIMHHLAVQSLHDSRRLETPVHKTMSIIMTMTTIGMDRVWSVSSHRMACSWRIIIWFEKNSKLGMQTRGDDDCFGKFLLKLTKTLSFDWISPKKFRTEEKNSGVKSKKKTESVSLEFPALSLKPEFFSGLEVQMPRSLILIHNHWKCSSSFCFCFCLRFSWVTKSPLPMCL